MIQREDQYERIQRSRENVIADNVVSNSRSADPFQQPQRSSLELLAAIARMSSARPAEDKGGSSSISCSKWLEHSRSLGFHFTPVYFDVICGRGKSAWNHTGNAFFRGLVKQATPAYSKVRTKAERSVIVSEIVDNIRSRRTGFVKKDEKDGEWIEVGDLLAREKVGQMLRNVLSSKYRSSITSKKRRRRDAQATRLESLHEVMETNEQIQHSMVTLKEGAGTGGLSEADLMALFAHEQVNMLEQIKGDKELVNRFLQAEVSACLAIDDDRSTGTADSDGDVEMTSV
jgi:hypothetical protein